MKLAVVIAARNEIQLLPEQLDALEAERWAGDWEVVVVDNGSTDGTIELVETRAETWPRLRLLKADERPGKPFAINSAVAIIEADAFAITDADDVVAPGWVAAMATALQAADVVTGPVDLDALNPPWLAASRGRSGESLVPMYCGLSFVRGNNYGATRDAFRRAGPIAEDAFPTDDMDLSLNLRQEGIAIVGVPDAVVRYRYRGDVRSLWRQGFAYGAARCRVARQLLDLGDPRPRRFGGIRSWGWLVLHMPSLFRRRARPAWVWVAANRLGHVRGSIRHRLVHL